MVKIYQCHDMYHGLVINIVYKQNKVFCQKRKPGRLVSQAYSDWPATPSGISFSTGDWLNPVTEDRKLGNQDEVRNWSIGETLLTDRGWTDDQSRFWGAGSRIRKACGANVHLKDPNCGDVDRFLRSMSLAELKP